MTTQDLVNQALKLKAADRLAIADALMASLDRPDAEIETLWADEAQRRAKAFDLGALPTVSADEALS
jgi:hypothetical protein